MKSLIQYLLLNHKTIVTTFLLLVSTFSYADKPVPPFPYVTTADFGSTYFIMVPEKAEFDPVNGYKIIKPAFGKAYELQDDGSSTLLWEVNGWFAFSTYLSDRGGYLVRMGDWPQGSKPSHEDMAVTFYHNGNEIKRYSTADLVKNKRKVEKTISHYFWLAKDSNYPKLRYDNTFLLKTIDGYLYEFDISTGNIIKSTKE